MPRKLKQKFPGRSINPSERRDRADVLRQTGCSWCLLGERPDGYGLCENCTYQFRRRLQSDQWHKLRVALLGQNPFCVACSVQGRYHPATDVDHIKPWRYFPDLFWEPTNHQCLNRDCHTRKTLLEKRLYQEELSQEDQPDKQSIPTDENGLYRE